MCFQELICLTNRLKIKTDICSITRFMLNSLTIYLKQSRIL
nr:MAG TPA: hypothetical protein [Caudoviricetes sp.]